LRIRLLYDGGYFHRAQAMLREWGPEDFSQHIYRLEFVYRSARLAHALGDWEEAFAKYKLTLEMGSKDTAYYACKSALELGHLYEQKGDKERAAHYYHLCLSLKPDEYRTGLHQAAKTGLERL